jgi:pimeloyl-ACP methyl ester carboxylesterase
MKHRLTLPFRRGSIYRITIIWAVFLMGTLLMVSACTSQSKIPSIEEISFKSGSFQIVGDLRLPGGKGPFPVILIVHGSGPANRTVDGTFLPVFDRMLRAGYAVFSWDKPGSGESTGTLEQGKVFKQRAQIVLDAIQVMKKRHDLDTKRIGLAGISQAGYVMPRVLSLSKDIAFMVCVSCPGIASVDQMAYQIAAQGTCAGVPDDQSDQLNNLLAELDKVRTITTYDEYLHYRELLTTMAETWPDSNYSYQHKVVPQDAWKENNPEIENWWNPIRVIEQEKIPVLAFFGDKDTNIDPIQGVYAYREAIKQSVNPKDRVVLISGANHGMTLVETGCIDEMVQIGVNGEWHITPEFLDTLEQWLKELH